MNIIKRSAADVVDFTDNTRPQDGIVVAFMNEAERDKIASALRTAAAKYDECAEACGKAGGQFRPLVDTFIGQSADARQLANDLDLE